MRILLVEDHLAVAKLIRQQLSSKYVIDLSSRGKKALDLLMCNDYSLIILDVGLPDMSGFDLCKKIRQFNSKVPILILTAHSEIEDKIKGFNLGADDYLLKPFEIEELTARINALLRRAKGSSIINLKYGQLSYNLGEKTVDYASNKIDLNRKELLILELLLRSKGKIVPRETILNNVWNKSESSNNIVEVQISNIRKKIDKKFNLEIIKTIHGLGYKIG
jgi:DNA-binding response OmpR family regulator